jgi:rod shape-determining protein MreD
MSAFMRFDGFQRDQSLPTRLVPFTTTFLFTLISVVPLHIPGFAVVTPSFALMAIYHWTIYRSDLLPPVAVFGTGILLDLLNGAPYVGTSSLLLLVLRQVLLSQRRFFVNRPFAYLWAGFLLVTVAMTVLEWALVSLLHGSVLDAEAPIFGAALTAASFPVGSYLLGRTQRGLLMRG